MKSKRIFAVLLCFFMTSVAAGAQEKMTVEQLEKKGFAAIDRDNKGWIGIGAVEAYRKLVFTSMDTNDDKKVTVKEYLAWDIGASQLADNIGKKDLYDAAKKVIFFYRDSNGDGALSKAEHRNSFLRDFRRADQNGDGVLSKEEFNKAFSDIAALKAAIR